MQNPEAKQTRLAWAIETAPKHPRQWSREHGATPVQILIETALAAGEPPKPEKINVVNLDLTWDVLSRGLRLMYAFDPDLCGPIAWVFFGWCGTPGKSYVEVIDSWVKPAYRRQGIRSKMNEAFFEQWKADAVVTAMGSEKFGEPFMKASGYVQDELGRWMLTREVWEARKALKGGEK